MEWNEIDRATWSTWVTAQLVSVSSLYIHKTGHDPYPLGGKPHSLLHMCVTALQYKMQQADMLGCICVHTVIGDASAYGAYAPVYDCL